MTEIIEMVKEYIKPELLLVIPVMWGFGTALKSSKTFRDEMIPLVLIAGGILLSSLWVVGTAELNGWQSVVLCVFTAITQGALCGSAAVGLHQLKKQTSEAVEKVNNQ